MLRLLEGRDVGLHREAGGLWEPRMGCAWVLAWQNTMVTSIADLGRHFQQILGKDRTNLRFIWPESKLEWDGYRGGLERWRGINRKSFGFLTEEPQPAWLTQSLWQMEGRSQSRLDNSMGTEGVRMPTASVPCAGIFLCRVEMQRHQQEGKMP